VIDYFVYTGNECFSDHDIKAAEIYHQPDIMTLTLTPDNEQRIFLVPLESWRMVKVGSIYDD
jgi:hypothetical protein